MYQYFMQIPIPVENSGIDNFLVKSSSTVVAILRLPGKFESQENHVGCIWYCIGLSFEPCCTMVFKQNQSNVSRKRICFIQLLIYQNISYFTGTCFFCDLAEMHPHTALTVSSGNIDSDFWMVSIIIINFVLILFDIHYRVYPFQVWYHNL